MRIQRASVSPSQPLATLDQDYQLAVLHLAWDRHGERVTLLFAMVELLPVEVPPPLDDGEQTAALGDSGHTLHLRRVVLPAMRALSWYLDCRRGRAVLPAIDGSVPQPDDADATLLMLADLGEVPTWPALVCVSGATDTIPFCPAWHGNPRVHHLVPLVDVQPALLWSDAHDRERASEWLTHRLHFRLDDYPQYRGSIHLVAPNPVYRALAQRLHSVPGGGEREVLRFELRVGHTVEGLALSITEEQEWGLLSAQQVQVDSRMLVFDFARQIDATRITVHEKGRGVLQAQPQAYQFLRSIHIRANVDGISSTQVIGDAPSHKHVVAGGEARLASATARLHLLHQARREKITGENK